MNALINGQIVAIIYARVSLERRHLQEAEGPKRRRGRFVSVRQQIDESQEHCAEQGWPVFKVLRDDAISASAYSNKGRPGYSKIPATIAEAKRSHPGARIMLVAWEDARMTRRPREGEDMIDLCRSTGALLCYSGTVYDPEDPEARYMLRMAVAAAARESDKISKRTSRDVRARARDGRPHAKMPYGYRRTFDPITGEALDWAIDPEKAEIVREIAWRIIKGEKMRQIARDLNERGVPAPGRNPLVPGRRWSGSQIQQMIGRPTYAGYRTVGDKIVGRGIWDPILTEREYRLLRAVLDRDDRRTNDERGPASTHLASGWATCGVCGENIRYSGGPSRPSPKYVCRDSHLTRRAADVDQMIHAAMLELLTDPGVADRLGQPDTTAAEARAAAREEAKKLREELDEWVTEAVEAGTSARAIAAKERTMGDQIAEAEARAREGLELPLLADLIGRTAEDAEAFWFGLDIADQRRAASHLLNVKLLPVTRRGRTSFDPSSVEIRWRF